MLSFEGDPKINIWRLEDGIFLKVIVGLVMGDGIPLREGGEGGQSNKFIEK